MSYRVYSFLSKITDTLPIGGGAIGAASQASHFINIPSVGVLFTAFIFSLIGASGGYLAKLFFDVIFRKIKKKYNC